MTSSRDQNPEQPADPWPQSDEDWDAPGSGSRWPRQPPSYADEPPGVSYSPAPQYPPEQYPPGQYSPGPSYPAQPAQPPGGTYAPSPDYPAHRYRPPDTEPRRGPSPALVITLVALLVVVAGGALAFYLVQRGGSGLSPSDPRSIRTGDCVVNRGTAQNVQLRRIDCAPGRPEVLRRFAGTHDTTVCRGVPGATAYYFYRTDPPSDQDFVLCLSHQ